MTMTYEINASRFAAWLYYDGHHPELLKFRSPRGDELSVAVRANGRVGVFHRIGACIGQSAHPVTPGQGFYCQIRFVEGLGFGAPPPEQMSAPMVPAVFAEVEIPVSVA